MEASIKMSFDEMQKKVDKLQNAVSKVQYKLKTITPDQMSVVEDRLKTITGHLGQLINTSAVIEQVALLLNQRSDPDGLRIVATLCRRVTDEPGWFKKCYKLSLEDVIEQVRGEL
jgi:hypothetical protein